MESETSIKKYDFKIVIEFIRKFAVFIFIIAICLIIGAIVPEFLAPENILTILKTATILAIISFGMTFVMICEGTRLGIDLSVGTVVSLSASVFAGSIVAGIPLLAAIIICIVLGLIIGLINGVLAISIKITPFIATLCTMFILKGVDLLYSKGNPIFPEAKQKFLFIYSSNVGPFGLPIIIVLVISIILYLILNKSSFGLRLYAIGFSRIASESSGINIKKYRYIAYVVSALMAALAGVLLCSRLGGSPIHVGDPMLMDVVAAAFIGTAASNDGRPTIIGTLVGAILYEALTNGFMFLGISYSYMTLLKGIIIIFIVASASLVTETNEV